MKAGWVWAGLVLGAGLWAAAGLPCRAAEQEGGLTWAVQADGQGEPFSVKKDEAGRIFPQDLLLWRPDVGFTVLKRGVPLPRELPQGLAVDLWVRDRQASPVAGVALEYRPLDAPNLPEPFGRISTDAAGRARLFLQPGHVLLVWISSPRFLPGAVTVDGSASTVEVKALPAPPGSFRVEGPFGRALAGASALFLPDEAPRNPLLLAQERKTAARRVLADAQGFLRLGEGAANRPFLLWAKGYTLREVDGVPDFSALSLQKASAISLRLRMPEGTAPAWKAEVRHLAKGLPWLSVTEEWAFTGPEGKVCPPAFPCEVSVRAEGCAEEVLSLKALPSGVVNISLRKGVLLAGVVQDEGGLKIQGAQVCLGEPRSSRFVVTDAEGRFAFPLQDAGEAPWDLFVSADGFLTGELLGIAPEKAGACRVVLSRGAGFFGRVELLGEGAPPSSFQVRAEAVTRQSSQGASFEVEAKADGTFEATGLEEGTYRVQAFSRGRRSPAVAVEVKAGLLTDAGTLMLDRKPAVQGTLAVRGESAPDAREADIRLLRVMGPAEAATRAEAARKADEAGGDGSFSFWGVLEGEYRVEAHWAGMAARSGRFRVEEEDVQVGTLFLEKEGILRGRLISRSPRDFSGFRILLQNGALDFDGPSATAGSDGAFSLGPLSPGPYTLSVFEPFSVVPKARRRVEVQAGGEGQEIPVPLEGVDVAVQARLDGRPAPSGVLSFEAAHDESWGAPLAIGTPEGMLILGFPAPLVSGETDGGGFTLLRECPPGPGTATLSWNGGEWTMPVTVPDRPQGTLTWDFRGLSLEGRVVDEEGKGAGGVLVTWEYVGRGPLPNAGVRTDSSGGFVLSDLAPGEVRLRAADPQRGGGEATVALPLAVPVPVEVRLHRTGP